MVNTNTLIEERWSKLNPSSLDDFIILAVLRTNSIVSNAKQLIKLNKNQRYIPKGYSAVYVGEVQKKRFVVPLSYLDQPLFQDLLRRSEDEFGFNHPMGGLTILCREEAFVHLSNQLHIS
ncbi:small auxin-up RNA [Tanacetum coccineum]